MTPPPYAQVPIAALEAVVGRWVHGDEAGPWPEEVAILHLALCQSRALHPVSPTPFPSQRDLASTWRWTRGRVSRLVVGRESVWSTASGDRASLWAERRPWGAPTPPRERGVEGSTKKNPPEPRSTRDPLSIRNPRTNAANTPDSDPEAIHSRSTSPSVRTIKDPDPDPDPSSLRSEGSRARAGRAPPPAGGGESDPHPPAAVAHAVAECDRHWRDARRAVDPAASGVADPPWSARHGPGRLVAQTVAQLGADAAIAVAAWVADAPDDPRWGGDRAAWVASQGDPRLAWGAAHRRQAASHAAAWAAARARGAPTRHEQAPPARGSPGARQVSTLTDLALALSQPPIPR